MKNLTLGLGLVILTLGASAEAQTPLTYNCSVERTSSQAATLQSSEILKIFLACDGLPSANHEPLGPEGLAEVWVPVTQKTLINQLQSTHQKAKFQVTTTYSGITLAINGRAVGPIDPLAARIRGITVYDNLGSNLDVRVNQYLNAMQVSPIARHACNPRNLAEACRDVTDRGLVLKQYKTNFFELSVYQSGGAFAYNIWNEGTASVGVNGLSDQPGGDVITLSLEDSAQVRKVFRFGPHAEFSVSQPSFKSVSIDDDGRTVRITIKGSN